MREARIFGKITNKTNLELVDPTSAASRNHRNPFHRLPVRRTNARHYGWQQVLSERL